MAKFVSATAGNCLGHARNRISGRLANVQIVSGSESPDL